MGTQPSLEFHHIGVPVKEQRANERYSRLYGMYTSDGPNQEIHIQFHRFDENSILDKRIQERVHMAFKTNNIEEYLQDKEIIDTTLSEKEIWEDDHSNSVLYPSEK